MFDLDLFDEFEAHKKVDWDGLDEYDDGSIHIDGLRVFIEVPVAYKLLNET